MSIGKRRALVYVVMLLSLLAAVNLIRDIFRLNQADSRSEAAREELNSARENQVQLKRQLEFTSQNFWQETQIRNVLKMSLPGEKVVILPEAVIMAEGQPIAGRESVLEERSNWQKWLDVIISANELF